jgi:ribonuclease HII
MIVAGIDEAGYGPLLGPLVVSASAFAMPECRDEGTAADLPEQINDLPCCWKLLKAALTKKAPITKGRVIIADSKVVHHLSDGLKHLERGVLAMLAQSGMRPATASALLEALGCDPDQLTEHPWYAAHDPPLPWVSQAGDLAIASNMVRAAMARSGVKLCSMRTVLVPEQRFNTMVEQTNNKAAVAVSITLSHLYYLHTQFGAADLVVGIDKQGGRDNYTSLLLRTFPDAAIRVILESDAGSSYMITETIAGRRHRTLVHFRQKGESLFMPVALASMICKYLRELYMDVFNAWWCQRIDGLKPTAGYHQDGTRWLENVQPHLARLNIAREHLVRIR